MIAQARPIVSLLAAGVALALPAVAQADELIGVCAGDNLCSASPATGKLTPITTDGASGPYESPSLSLDGTALAYLRAGAPYRGPSRPDGTTKLEDTTKAREIRIRPDGRASTHRDFQFFGEDLQSVLIVSGAIGPNGETGVRRYVSSSSALYAAWLGSTLMIAESGTKYCTVVLIAASDDPPPCGKVVAERPGFGLFGGHGSPDGTKVVASSLQSDEMGNTVSRAITLFDASNGTVIRELTPGPADSDPEFSPDGAQVIFTRDSDTWVVPTAGGAPRLLAAGLTDATWGGAAPGTLPPGTLPTGTQKGRATLKGSTFRVRGRVISARARCRSSAGCRKTNWTLRRGRVTVARVTVRALAPRASTIVRARLTRKGARLLARSGRRGLRLKLLGAGKSPLRVTARRK